jgi:hypothetical protein
VLLLSLALQDQNNKVQDINMELPAADLDKLLASMNAANDVCVREPRNTHQVP